MGGFLVAKEVFDARMKVCEACEFYTKLGTCGHYPNEPVKYKGKRYKLCGCPMKVLKGRLAVSECPVGKWGKGQLREEQLQRGREVLKKYTDEQGKIKTGNVNANEVAGVWQMLTGEVAHVGCGGCVKEVLQQLQRYIANEDNRK